MIEIITVVNIDRIDLNLLRSLDALLEERSTTRAAKRLGVTQPAASNALSRLRELFGDELLVRVGATMLPTPRAAELAPKLRAALSGLGDALHAGPAFDPATTAARFTIAATDYFEMVLLPSIAARLTARAPGASLDVRSIGERSPLDAIAEGSLDGALGVFGKLGPGFHAKRLGSERFVCVVRKRHPALKSGKMTLATYAALGHLLVAPRRTGPGAVDAALGREGLTRHVALHVSHFLVAPLVIAETDLVATLPARVAALLGEKLGLVTFAPPVELGSFPLMWIWHERTHRSEPHRFLRDAISIVDPATKEGTKR